MGVRLGSILLATVAMATAGCAEGAADSAGGGKDRLRIVTTVSPITSIVANIAGGGLTEIVGLVPEGTNSHTFEPPPSAAKTLAGADVLFINGLQLEDPTLELAEENLPDHALLVGLGDETLDEADYIFDFSFPRGQGKPNPHLWTNPPMARRYAEVVKETLVDLDPANAGAYESNFDRYAAKIDALDGALRAATATVAPDRRKLLTYHDAFAYFAREYGWTIIGAIQLSDFEDPTPKELGALINQVRDVKVPAIFGSEVFPSPVLAQIGRETGVRYVDELRDDDLPGEPGDEDHSFLGLMRHDFVAIVEALGGDASALSALDIDDVTRDTARYPQ